MKIDKEQLIKGIESVTKSPITEIESRIKAIEMKLQENGIQDLYEAYDIWNGLDDDKKRVFAVKMAGNNSLSYFHLAMDLLSPVEKH